MKINIGDVVTLKPAQVVAVQPTEIGIISPTAGVLWISRASVDSVAARPLQVGDIVTWRRTKISNFEIVAIKGEMAVVYNDKDFFDPRSCVVRLSELEKVEA